MLLWFIAFSLGLAIRARVVLRANPLPSDVGHGLEVERKDVEIVLVDHAEAEVRIVRSDPMIFNSRVVIRLARVLGERDVRVADGILGEESTADKARQADCSPQRNDGLIVPDALYRPTDWDLWEAACGMGPISAFACGRGGTGSPDIGCFQEVTIGKRARGVPRRPTHPLCRYE